MKEAIFDEYRKKHLSGGNKRAICYTCNAIVTTNPQLVTTNDESICSVKLEEPIVDLMVYVCERCNDVVGIPHNASYQIRHALEKQQNKLGDNNGCGS